MNKWREDMLNSRKVNSYTPWNLRCLNHFVSQNVDDPKDIIYFDLKLDYEPVNVKENTLMNES